jgi:peptidoglycan/xylan/chitin deacetylase (PgdA/CDA1 family)
MKTPTVYVPGEARFPRILAYHEVSPQFQLGVTSISPRRFGDHLDFLVDLGLGFVPLRGSSEQFPENAVCLTFDDGYASFLEHVLPLLMARKLPATLFIITDFVGKTNDWDITFGMNRRRHLDWPQVKEISRAGIEIGSHGATHRDLTRLARLEMISDLGESRKTLEDNLGRSITSLALPFGAVNVEVFSCARNLGYKEICGGPPGLRGYFAGVLPRLPVYKGDGVRALGRKIELGLWERSRLLFLRSFSRGTRFLKSR